jgi:hypothetical protein
MVVRTAAEVFPHVTVWHGPWLYSWVINGSVEPRPPDMALLMKHFSKPAVRADLETIPIRTPFEFLNHFVMAGDEVWDFVGDAPLITDDRTRLDFSVPRSHDSFFGISNSITDYYLVDLMDPEAERVICRHKQPVFPHLRNPAAAGLEPEEVRESLESLLGSFPHGGCVGKAQAQAARLRR